MSGTWGGAEIDGVPASEPYDMIGALSTPWFLCIGCNTYAPVTALRVEDEDYLSGEALTYVHRDEDECGTP
jgi:hypothetical protein